VLIVLTEDKLEDKVENLMGVMGVGAGMGGVVKNEFVNVLQKVF
jgi:hypothetical protein